MMGLLDEWIPPDERTTELVHLSTWLEEDEQQLPPFVNEWMLDDIKAGGTHRAAFTQDGHQWAAFSYVLDMQ